MTDSILTSVKKALNGIDEDYTFFDDQLIMHINSVFMILYQMGVGPSTPFKITDKTATWSDFCGDFSDIEAVKTYVTLKVKLIFDPPVASAHLQALDHCIKECEWRLYSAESTTNFDPDKTAEIYADFGRTLDHDDTDSSSSSTRIRRTEVWYTG